MALYSKDDAGYLISFYSTKVVGGLLETSTGSKVKRVYIEQVGDKYEVRCEGTTIKGLNPHRSVELVAKTQNLLLPDQVLKQKNSN